MITCHLLIFFYKAWVFPKNRFSDKFLKVWQSHWITQASARPRLLKFWYFRTLQLNFQMFFVKIWPRLWLGVGNTEEILLLLCVSSSGNRKNEIRLLNRSCTMIMLCLWLVPYLESFLPSSFVGWEFLCAYHMISSFSSQTLTYGTRRWSGLYVWILERDHP